MVEVVATQEAFARRQVLMVPGYTETGSDENYYVTQFFGALPANVDPNPPAEAMGRPQAYYVEQPPQATVPPHYHDTNQYQVFLEGSAIFGRKPVGAMAVHYASGHTPYGPIITKDHATHYLTMRNQWDSGGKTMPQSRPTLRKVRRRFRMIEKIDQPDLASLASGAVDRQDALACEDDGLGVATFGLGAGAQTDLALAAPGEGRFGLVIEGMLRGQDTDLDAGSCVYIGPADQGQFQAGPDGAAVLVMQFPPEPI